MTKFKVGDKVKTRDGRDAEILKVDLIVSGDIKIVAAISNNSTQQFVREFNENGFRYDNGIEYCLDLIPPFDPSTLKVDDKVLVSMDNNTWDRRHFSHFDYEHSEFCCFEFGKTSWTCDRLASWKYIKLPEDN